METIEDGLISPQPCPRLTPTSRLEWERKESRLAIFPLLQAEEDRKYQLVLHATDGVFFLSRQVRMEFQRELAEAKIMSEVKVMMNCSIF